MKIDRTPSKSDVDPQFLIAEYNAIRNEILKRSEFRYQIVSLTLIIAGTLLTFGLEPTSSAHVLFIFPILGCFLAGIWVHNVTVPRQLAAFIKNHIESKFGGWGWETSSEPTKYSFMWLSGIISSGGIFLGTEIIALLLGVLKSTFSPIDIVLIACDVIAISITIILLRSTIQKPQKEKESRSIITGRKTKIK